MLPQTSLSQLAASLDGELHYDETLRKLYATDASAYRELPQAVAFPKSESDLQRLIAFANQHHSSLIPRTAGTSLAGQVVGNGIVVDFSVHFRQILGINPEERTVTVQPGVVRDELNLALKAHGLYFGPETSTANRAMIGGMVGNNSCGSNSVIYGSTRDHLRQVRGFLSDGSEVTFGALTHEELARKAAGSGLEAEIYRTLQTMLGDPDNQVRIRRHFPKPSIPRRNTGYALDLLLDTAAFTPGGPDFNLCRLIAGSEGTLMMLSEITLNLSPLPPSQALLVCPHFHTVDESLRANLIALQYRPTACELMDHHIFACTENNTTQRANRFFVEGTPGAVLAIELKSEDAEQLERQASQLIANLKAKGLGYYFPIVRGEDIGKVWALRKAGLGLLSNMPGDAKPAPVIEDTAVDVEDLPAYIAEFNQQLQKRGLSCVHYAHAGSGELHLRPILNLKTRHGQQLFREVATDIAHLVKKYRGSLSGEHGDGRLRGEFIRTMIGDDNYALLKEVKQAFDPHNLFNPGKIVDTPPMDTSLRFAPDQPTPQFDTAFDWSSTQGLLRAAEQCNGSGDCRKTHLAGGTMCPSYMATRLEKDTTRARANILREVLTQSDRQNPFDSEEIKTVMDLCLSCKGCKAECPSNVDVGKLKAEWQYQYYKAHGVPLRSRLMANFGKMASLAAATPGLFNWASNRSPLSPLLKKTLGIAPQRSLPTLHKRTLRQWFARHKPLSPPQPKGRVVLFCDEFTNYNDTPIGIKTVELIERLGYEVILPRHAESGRAQLSKGLLDDARQLAIANVKALAHLVGPDTPLVGVEPSAILSFRDEYPDLLPEWHQGKARKIADHALLLEEWIVREWEANRIRTEQFTDEQRTIRFHGHCHQKALSSLVYPKKALQIPVNYTMQLIPSGCCGMAGSFGYEQEHYEVSMQIGELVLFPAVRKSQPDTLICAPGTSCRHQIWDGTGRKALHPAEVLWSALA